MSIRYIKCQYVHQQTEAKFLYEALRQGPKDADRVCVWLQGLGLETAEKQPPSSVELAVMFRMAVDEMKKGGKKMTMAQMLNQCINDYNSGISIRKFKVDGHKKKIITSLLKVPDELLGIVTKHYDTHKHASSGTGPLKQTCFLKVVAV